MNKIHLTFKSLSRIVGNDDIGLLLLADDEERRQITISCDKGMLYEFGLRMKQVPVTKSLLPEALWQMLRMQGNSDFEILVFGIDDGQYQCILTNRETLDTVSLRASDAVLLAFIAKIDIFIEESLFQRQSLPYSKESHGLSLPVNAISTGMLHTALDHAVEEENYELASQIRDELRKREGKHLERP